MPLKYSVSQASKLVSTKTLSLKHYYRRQGVMPFGRPVTLEIRRWKSSFLRGRSGRRFRERPPELMQLVLTLLVLLVFGDKHATTNVQHRFVQFFLLSFLLFCIWHATSFMPLDTATRAKTGRTTQVFTTQSGRAHATGVVLSEKACFCLLCAFSTVPS